MSTVRIEVLADPTAADTQQLASLLHANVHDGASVSFILPFTEGAALQWWEEKVIPQVTSNKRHILVARAHGEIVGSVQLILDTPPNQPHRADVAKLLVHPKARRQGIARLLMIALEQLALHEQRTLLTLDTVTGSAAEPLYQSLGYQLSGRIPGYALNTASTVYESTSIYYKQLESGMPRANFPQLFE